MYSDLEKSLSQRSYHQLDEDKNELKKKSIAAGSFGIVSKIQYSNEFALKEMFLARFKNSKEFEEELKSVFGEYETMKSSLRNVVKSHHYFYQPKKKLFSFTMDLMKSNLEDYVEHPIDFNEFFPIFMNIVTGRFYL